MRFSKSLVRAGLVLVMAFAPMALSAETNCEEGSGPLDPAQPKSMTVQQIIDKFAAREAMFKQARNNYAYTQDVTIQELDGNTVEGEFRLVQDITFDDKGGRVESVTFAPQPSLRGISLSKEDYEDFRTAMSFILTTEELPKYNLLYVGQQHIDEIETYAFDMAPKNIEKGQRYFQGRIWVDAKDLQIVKSCGRTVPQTHAENSGKKKKKVEQENLSPKFVTYREQIDGQFWFPTFTRADEVLHFINNDAHVRETIKYTNYKRFGVHTRITMKGEAKDQEQAPPSKKP